MNQNFDELLISLGKRPLLTDTFVDEIWSRIAVREEQRNARVRRVVTTACLTGALVSGLVLSSTDRGQLSKWSINGTTSLAPSVLLGGSR